MVTDVITITVSAKEDVDWIRSQVRNGSFASEAEVIADAIESLREQAAELETSAQERTRWELDVLLPSHDRLLANPSSAVTDEELGKALEEGRRLRRKAS